MRDVVLLLASRSDYSSMVLGVILPLLTVAVVILSVNVGQPKAPRGSPRVPILPARLDVDLVEVRVLPGGLCQVCCTGMGQEFVRCVACRTPHHAECWDYMGRCSTFACGGKRSVKAPLSGHGRGAAAS